MSWPLRRSVMPRLMTTIDGLPCCPGRRRSVACSPITCGRARRRPAHRVDRPADVHRHGGRRRRRAVVRTLSAICPRPWSGSASATRAGLWGIAEALTYFRAVGARADGAARSSRSSVALVAGRLTLPRPRRSWPGSASRRSVSRTAQSHWPTRDAGPAPSGCSPRSSRGRADGGPAARAVGVALERSAADRRGRRGLPASARCPGRGRRRVVAVRRRMGVAARSRRCGTRIRFAANGRSGGRPRRCERPPAGRCGRGMGLRRDRRFGRRRVRRRDRAGDCAGTCTGALVGVGCHAERRPRLRSAGRVGDRPARPVAAPTTRPRPGC